LTADVRWNLVDLRIAVDEHPLHPRRRADGEREHPVAVMIVREDGELFLTDEPCRLTVARALGHVVEREAR
jgi:hypothetical protein